MTPVNDQDLELLSAYLDDELGASQRSALEMRLTTDPALAAALQELQQTVGILRAAPRLAVPRNFTLDPARHARPAPWWMRYGVMQLVGAVGAAASVLIIAAGVYLTGMSATGAPINAGRNAVAQAGAVSNTGITEESTSLPTSSPTALATQSPLSKVDATSAGLVAGESAAQSPTAAPTATPTTTVTANLFLTQQTGADAAVVPPGSPGDLTIPADDIGMGQGGGTAPNMDGFGQNPDANAAQPNPQQNNPVLVATLAASPTVVPATVALATAAPSTVAAAYGATRDDQSLQATSVAEFADGITKDKTAATTNEQAAQDAETDQIKSDNQVQSAGSQFIVIIGIALLVFSVMLFLLGWMRTRQRV